MKINGTYELNVPRQQVWDSMMDPDVLTRCIPACQVIEKISDDEFHARVNVKFGIIPVRFNVRVNLSNVSQPEKYSLEAQAEGGFAHAARALGDVEFVSQHDHITRVVFVGQVLPGSKLFELGEGLVQKTASKWFTRFFERFEQAIIDS